MPAKKQTENLRNYKNKKLKYEKNWLPNRKMLEKISDANGDDDGESREQNLKKRS